MSTRKHSDSASFKSEFVMSKRKNEASMVSLESMRQHLECPICNEVPRNGAMLMCLNGHNVCAACKNKMEKDARCPIGRCRFNTPPAKNFAVANLIEKLPFEWPCKYKEAGCEVRDTGRSLEAHEPSCRHRPVPCPDHGCGERMSADSIFEHLEMVHRTTAVDLDLYVGANEAILRLMWKHIWNPNEDFYWIEKVYLRKIGNALLCAQVRKSKVYMWLWAILDEAQANKFECQISLNNCNNGVSMIVVCPVYPIGRDRRKILTDDDCLRLEWWFFRRLITEKGLEQARRQQGYSQCIINFKVSRKADDEIIRVE